MNDEILIKFLLKETSNTESEAVNTWLLAKPENAAYYTQFEKIWNTSKDLQTENTIDENTAWLKFKAKADAIKPQPIVKPLKGNYNWLSIAAIFLLAIGSWSVYTFLNSSNYTNIISNNQVISKILPDGSELTINKNSEISYAANFKSHRNLQLKKGEVFFNVAHDKSKPFIIKIDKVAVEVVGTSFNIKYLNNATEVTVETGIVKVSLGNEQIELIKGERILIDAKTQSLVKEKITDQLYNYYRSKLFVATNTPLHKLINVLNEAYGSDIKLTEDVKNLTIYTTLPLGSLDQNLQNICETLNLKVTRNQQEILLSNK
jgi:ferric-dicitrate binding protein FerR (iron transport regulator)